MTLLDKTIAVPVVAPAAKKGLPSHLQKVPNSNITEVDLERIGFVSIKIRILKFF